MNSFVKKFLNLQCRIKHAADILRKQQCFSLTENLDNSMRASDKYEVVQPETCICLHLFMGWRVIYFSRCELIFILCTQVVQNLLSKSERMFTPFLCSLFTNTKN